MKKAKILVLFFLMGAVLITSAQTKEKIKGNRIVKFMQTPIELFGAIDIGEDLEVALVQGEKTMIEIEADENLHDVIHFVAFNGLLTIQTSKKIVSSKELKIRIYHTGELFSIVAREDAVIRSLSDLNLKKLTISAANASKIYLTLRTEEFKLSSSENAKSELKLTSKTAAFILNGDSKLKASVTAEDCKIDMYQRAEAKMDGNTNSLSLRLDNNAYFMGENLISKQCKLTAESNVDCYVNAANSIALEASGNAKIYIYNTPKIDLEKFLDSATLYKKN